MQTTGLQIGVTLAPSHLELMPGGMARVTVGVTNLAAVVDQFELQIEGLDPAWCTIAVTSLSLFPGAAGSFTLEIQLPEQPPPPAGRHEVHVAVTSRDGRQTATATLTLDILAIGGLQLAIAPQRVTARRTGRFRAVITNDGNAEHVIDLMASDPEGALRMELLEDRVAVPAGGRREAPLVVRPRHRPLFAPPRRYPFTITAFPAGSEAAEPLGVATGELTVLAPLAFLAGVPRRLRAALLALAALLIAAAVAIWVFGAPVRQAAATAAQTAGEALIAASDHLSPGASTQGGAQTAASSQAAASNQASQAAAAQATAAAVPLPTITRFDLAVPPGAGRGEFELQWDVKGASQVTIDGTPQPASGSLRVQATADREFQLTATNAASASVTRSIGLVILRPPEIQQFTAEPAQVVRGQPATLSWEARGGSRASLNGQPVDPTHGSLQVQPEADTTYTLSIENEFGRAEQSTAIHVVEPSPAPG